MASFFDCYTGAGDGEDDASSSSSGGSNSDSSDSEEHEEEVQAAEVADKAADAPASVLPSFDDAFSAIVGPPGFLDPEATRPLAENARHKAKAAPPAGSSGQQEGDGDGFDVSALAPELGKKSGGPGARKAGVIESKAKIYTKQEQGTERGEITAFAIAMMGGNVDNMKPKDEAPVKRKQPSAAMGVQDFLEKGTGGALLPRKRQDRKDKDKSKRQLGQSSIGEWKTEAEMVLRQQYD